MHQIILHDFTSGGRKGGATQRGTPGVLRGASNVKLLKACMYRRWNFEVDGEMG